MKVGNKAVDLSKYDMIEFEAFGTGTIEVTISKKGITTWSNQYRTAVALNKNTPTLYQIPFSQFINNMGENNFVADDVVTVVFSIVGNEENFENFCYNINNLRIVNGTTDISEADNQNNTSMIVFPNPISETALLTFNLPTEANVKIGIYTIDGKLVQKVSEQKYNAGANAIKFNVESISRGVYFIKLETENTKIIEKIVLMN